MHGLCINFKKWILTMDTVTKKVKIHLELNRV